MSDESSEIVARYPLSPVQSDLWDEWLRDPTGWIQTHALRLSGALDRSLLERALDEIVGGQEILRTTFVEGEQRVHRARPTSLTVEDLSLHAEAAQLELLRAEATKDAERPMPLDQTPPFSARLFRLGETTHALTLTAHHMVYDDWSWDGIKRQLADNYAAFLNGKPSPHVKPTSSYGVYAQREHERMQGADVEAAQRAALDSLPAPLEFPSDRPFQHRPRSMKALGADLGELVGALINASKTTRVNGGTLLLASTHLLLARITGKKIVPASFPALLRTSVDHRRMFGPMLQVLPLVSDFSADPTFAEYAQQFSANILCAIRDRHLYPRHSLRPGTRFNTNFRNDTQKVEVEYPLKLEPLFMIPSMNMAQHLKPSFFLYAGGAADHLGCKAVYDANMFDEPRVRDILTQYKEILRVACLDPGVCVSTALHS